MRKHIPLTAILVVAAVARYWAIGFCLPALICRPDEEAVASVATGFFGRDLNPHFFDWPPLFMYAVALSMVPYFKFVKFTGSLRSEFRFLQSLTTDPAPLVLAARMISAAAGTASVWVLYRIAVRLFDRTTALIAAAFLALAYLHVRDSHFGVTDITATFFVLVTLLICARLTVTFTDRDLIVAGVMTGIAGATKYNAAAVALPVLWILISDRSGRSHADRLLRASWYCGISTVVFLILAPYSVIEYTAFVDSLLAVAAHLRSGHGPNVGRGWWVHLSSSLRYGVGAPMLVAGVAGLMSMMWRTPRVGVMVALFPLATYLTIGSGRTVFARYAVPLVPFVCLGAAYAVTECARALSQRAARPQLRARVAWLTAILILATSARAVWQFDRLLAIEDSRVIAAHWIEQRYSNGATIGETARRFERLSFGPANAPVSSRYSTVVLTAEGADPDVIIVSESALHPEGLGEALTEARAKRYVRALETSAPERAGSVYDWQDEFYIPLAGINHLDRPGPRLTVLIRR